MSVAELSKMRARRGLLPYSGPRTPEIVVRELTYRKLQVEEDLQELNARIRAVQVAIARKAGELAEIERQLTEHEVRSRR